MSVAKALQYMFFTENNDVSREACNSLGEQQWPLEAGHAPSECTNTQVHFLCHAVLCTDTQDTHARAHTGGTAERVNLVTTSESRLTRGEAGGGWC